MRFLLVTPVRTSLTQFVADECSKRSAPLDSRETSGEKLIGQKWTEVDPHSLLVGQDAEITAERAASCQVQNQRFFVVLVNTANDLPYELEVAELEKRLSSFAQAYTTAALGISGSDMPWVARYALLAAGEPSPTNWLNSRTRSIDISNDALATNGSCVEAALGWGNGVLSGWDHMPESGRDRFIHGLIDAQVIWNDASQIVEKNETVFDRLVTQIEKPSRRDVRALAPDCAQIQMHASVHQLLYDDLFQNVQGIRRVAAELLLSSWEYDRFVQRMLARVQDSSSQLELLRARLDSRYHAAVQSTLLVLGFLVVIDTALSFISTAYSGDVSGLPGGSLGIFHQLRTGDADLVLAVSLFVTIGLALLFTRRR